LRAAAAAGWFSPALRLLILRRARRLARGFLAVAAVAAAGFAPGASAQLIDSVDVTNDGANAIIRIRFQALIQYIRHAPVNEGNVIQVYFQITQGDQQSQTVVEEQRRPNPTDYLPAFTVTYPSQPPALLRRIDIRFATSVQFRLRPDGNAAIVVLVPLSDEQIAKLKPQGVKLPPSEIRTAPTNDVEREAQTLSRDSRAALEAGDFEKAVVSLNRLLNLPPNAWSEEAQEQIGLAREQLGEVTKAKAEYELYLKLYPDGPGAARIKQRLAALSAPVTAAGGGPVRPGALTYWGSISQYYYGGQSRATTKTTNVTPATGATTIDTADISGIDQSQLSNSIDLTTRYRDATWDNRIVVRDSYLVNFLKGGTNDNQLNALFAETRYQPLQLMGRFGRQSATNGGVLGLFDGAVAQWGFTDNWRVGGVVGQPADPQLGGTKKTFYGGIVEAENVGGKWGGNVFAIRQNVSGYEDRSGVGGELRYFDAGWNVYSVFDYDPTFRATNIAMIQGNINFPTGTSLNILFDYRRTPTLQLTNALVVDPNQSISQTVQTLGLSETRDIAKAVTPLSRVAFFGVTQQLNQQWTVGGDFRISSLSGTEPIGTNFPGVPSTGNVYTYNLQTIATGLTPYQDILVLNGSVLRSRDLDAVQFGLDFRFTVWQDFLIEPLYRWYRQTDNNDTKLTRQTPGLHVLWRIRERFSLEAEADYEMSHTNSPVIVDNVRRRFYYIGWRWDL
jgi:tetratricopeptide (TPR) repeat protein